MKAISFFQAKTNVLYQLALSQLRQQSLEMRRGLDAPLALAAAFALGTLTSFLPLPIFDSLLAVGLAFKFARLNKGAIFLARAVWNDLLVVPLYAPGFKVGQWLVGSLLNPEIVQEMIPTHFIWIGSFLLGTAILAVLAASAGFLAVLFIAKLAKKRKIDLI